MGINKLHLRLRTKFVAAITFVVVLFGLLNIYFNRESTIKVLREETNKRGLFLAKSISENNVRFLLYDDLISIQQLLDSTKEANEGIAYCFVTDSHNNVIAHTFGSRFPIEILEANKLLDGQAYHIQLISDENDIRYRDVMVPISEGKLGYLRLGLEEENIISKTNRVVLVLSGMVLGFFGIGILGALIFAYWITNPIMKITKAFETLDLNQEFKPLRIKTGDEINVLADKFNDMTLRLQKTHKELSEAQRGLIHSEKLASVGTFASGLTHEISSPLAGMKNCLIRITKNPGRDQINRYSSLMMNAILKIEKVVSGLLEFTRQDDYRFEPFSLNAAVERALSLVSYRLDKEGVSLEKSLAKNEEMICGDSHHIEQVVVNIVINAFDAMPKGGKLTISSFFYDSKACIEVKDTGMGIAPENLDKIFDPFFSTKEPGRGTGLGLAVSYGIVKKHQGDILVESEVNRGTKFIVSLPVKPVKSDK
jgi:two-component system NtrC family sensor kinase